MAKTDVVIRWWDGYMERFEAHNEPRFGCDFLWFETENSNRHIPLRGVRWFSIKPASHEQSQTV